MIKKISVFLIIISVTIATMSLFASEPSPWTKELTYTKKSLGKLNFGIKNIAFGWTEFLVQPYSFIRAKENIFIGVANGVFYAAANTTLGALQTGTFVIPKDIPLPDGNNIIRM